MANIELPEAVSGDVSDGNTRRLGHNEPTTHLCHDTTDNLGKSWVIGDRRKTVLRNFEHRGIDLPS